MSILLFLVICMKYIKRSIEDLVKASDKTFKCVLVTGARQTGKSTMLKALFPDKKYVPIDDVSAGRKGPFSAGEKGPITAG